MCQAIWPSPNLEYVLHFKDIGGRVGVSVTTPPAVGPDAVPVTDSPRGPDPAHPSRKSPTPRRPELRPELVGGRDQHNRINGLNATSLVQSGIGIADAPPGLALRTPDLRGASWHAFDPWTRQQPLVSRRRPDAPAVVTLWHAGECMQATETPHTAVGVQVALSQPSGVVVNDLVSRDDRPARFGSSRASNALTAASYRSDGLFSLYRARIRLFEPRGSSPRARGSMCGSHSAARSRPSPQPGQIEALSKLELPARRATSSRAGGGWAPPARERVSRK